MDSKTLKKVLGQVSHVANMFAAKITIFFIRMPASLCTIQQAWYACLSELNTWLPGESAELGEFSRF